MARNDSIGKTMKESNREEWGEEREQIKTKNLKKNEGITFLKTDYL